MDDALHRAAAARGADLRLVLEALQSAAAGRTTPSLPHSALATGAAALAAANVAAACVASRRARSLTYATADTVAACALLVALLVLVLGLPVGAAYLSARGAAYVYGGVTPWLLARVRVGGWL